jgi:hypothetical protein
MSTYRSTTPQAGDLPEGPWSLRQVAHAMGVSVGALHKYRQTYLHEIASGPTPNSGFRFTQMDLLMAIVVVELIAMGQEAPAIRETLVQLREICAPTEKADDLILLATAGTNRFVPEQQLSSEPIRALLYPVGRLTVLHLGQLKRAALEKLRRSGSRGPRS